MSQNSTPNTRGRGRGRGRGPRPEPLSTRPTTTPQQDYRVAYPDPRSPTGYSYTRVSAPAMPNPLTRPTNLTTRQNASSTPVQYPALQEKSQGYATQHTQRSHILATPTAGPGGPSPSVPVAYRGVPPREPRPYAMISPTAYTNSNWRQKWDVNEKESVDERGDLRRDTTSPTLEKIQNLRKEVVRRHKKGLEKGDENKEENGDKGDRKTKRPIREENEKSKGGSAKSLIYPTLDMSETPVQSQDALLDVSKPTYASILKPSTPPPPPPTIHDSNQPLHPPATTTSSKKKLVLKQMSSADVPEAVTTHPPSSPKSSASTGSTISLTDDEYDVIDEKAVDEDYQDVHGGRESGGNGEGKQAGRKWFRGWRN